MGTARNTKASFIYLLKEDVVARNTKASFIYLLKEDVVVLE